MYWSHGGTGDAVVIRERWASAGRAGDPLEGREYRIGSRYHTHAS